MTYGKAANTMEKGWTGMMAGLWLFLILLAAVPLLLSRSSFSTYVSGFFAALPFAMVGAILIFRSLPLFKKKV